MKSYPWSIILIVSCLLMGCKSKTQQASLEGEIKGLGSDTLYLYGTDEYFDRVDTIFVTDDKFSYTLPVDTLVLTILTVGDSIEYPLFIDKEDKIRIDADVNSTQFRMKGNALNELYTQFRNNLSDTDTLSVEQQAERFIRTHPSSLVSVYLLDHYFLRSEEPDYVKIKDLISSLSGDMKDLTFIQQASDIAEQQDKTTTGKMSPAFNLKNREGKSILRTSFRDKYLVLYFWASWSDSCSQIHPDLKKLHNTYKKKDNFELLGISLDLNRTDWEQAIEKDTLEWEQVSDFAGWNSSVIKQYGILDVPTFVLIGKDARIMEQKITLDSLSNKLKEVFETKK